MIEEEVIFAKINRSVESWGPLAKCSEEVFDQIINNRRGYTKDKIKKLKPYNVTFERRSYSESFEIMAEDDYDVGTKARAYYKENAAKIGFKEQQRSNWADGYAGYDNIRYSKVRT